MSILFARHGETDWNIEKRIQGTTDIPLNDNGIRQAELLSGNLKKENVTLCRIYSSYQRRALTTAEIIGMRHHVPVKVIPGLEEMNLGLFEGHTWAETEKRYPDEMKKWQSDKRYQKAPGGESCQDLLERLFAALDRILKETEAEISRGRDVLILTHGMVLLSLLTIKNDLDFRTSYTVIHTENARAVRLEPGELWEVRRKSLSPKRPH